MKIYASHHDSLEKIGINNYIGENSNISFPKGDENETEMLKSYQIDDKNDTSALVILGERDTLYKTNLERLNAFRKKISASILSVICLKLTSPKGNHERKWVSHQMGESNFNINIIGDFCPQKDEQGKKIIWNNETLFELNQKISLGIQATLNSFSNELCQIIYPFHHIYKGGKVAGHLVQISHETVRIGIGINSNFAPILPSNDVMAHQIYKSTSHLNMNTLLWGEIHDVLLKNITQHIFTHDKEKIQNNFGNALHIKEGDIVNVYEDNRDASLGNCLEKNVYLDSLDLKKGELKIGNSKFLYGEHHIIK